ncbi:hypothetical protein SAMN05421780_103169 [Flexibacter flexilis DSM 6793]|uniref:Uncharacterized protein n=1 Tax=Flexibacter flexilis DSM 6793 TaxID=927664 RepID=A0A1I1H985_9BACT|nr:hypothetical protein SAMN05421780_103169 [Flexibacter flexilis DSM 6793]
MPLIHGFLGVVLVLNFNRTNSTLHKNILFEHKTINVINPINTAF